MFYIVGLGNPGAEYEGSRHSAGRMAVLKMQKDFDLPEFEFHKKSNSLVSEGKVGKEKAMLILPETFMNKSGSAVTYFQKPKPKTSKKGLENLIVVYDDIDLAIGTMKISYNKGTGGHRGLDSVVKAVKTREFTRIRIGISPVTASGKIKKPGLALPPKAGEKVLLDFILTKFKPAELETLKKIFKNISAAVQTLVSEGRERAMNTFN